jgi:flagellar biosynthetic protein FliO
MSTGPDLMSTALQMVTALGLVLGGLFVVFYLMRRLLKRDIGGSKDQLIKVLANQYLGIKKNIALVEVPGAVLVIGISNDTISLLTKIEDSAILGVIQPNKSQLPPSFSDQLQRIAAKFKIAKSRE